jgi:hypothetical protein
MTGFQLTLLNGGVDYTIWSLLTSGFRETALLIVLFP